MFGYERFLGPATLNKVLSVGETLVLAATCPGGKFALGGGHLMSANSEVLRNVSIERSIAISDTTWEVWVTNNRLNAGVEVVISGHAFVVCGFVNP